MRDSERFVRWREPATGGRLLRPRRADQGRGRQRLRFGGVQSGDRAREGKPGPRFRGRGDQELLQLTTQAGSASLARRAATEALGAAGLVAVVVGSGIMGERLAGGNVAIALLANSLATAGGLYVLILALAPISGAHFNPAVTLVDVISKRMPRRDLVPYVAAQVAGAVAGTWIAQAMFALPLLQASTRVRAGFAQWLAEAVATFGLVACIRLVSRASP